MPLLVENFQILCSHAPHVIAYDENRLVDMIWCIIHLQIPEVSFYHIARAAFTLSLMHTAVLSMAPRKKVEITAIFVQFIQMQLNERNE